MTRALKRWWPNALGLSLLLVYLGWNVRWLAVGRIPPSMLTAATGLPSPTTGGTRSLLALLEGDLAMSFHYNPMTVPIVALLTLTIGQVLFKRRGDNWLAAAWIAALSIAWVVKLMSPRATW
ncbi:MAG: DUF2752 domain-containing protein [Pirellulaceae bacterium]